MVGDVILKLRIQNGMTQEALATYLDVTHGAVSHYELNRREPSIETLIKLSDKFGVTVDQLVRN